MRILLALVFAEQRDFIAVVLLIHQRRPQLRVRGQIAFGPHIPAVRRTGFIVVVKLRRIPPAGQAQVTIGPELQVVAPVLATEAHAAVVAGQVMVKKQVHASHVIRRKMAPARSGVELVAVIGAVKAVLGKEQVFRGVMPRQ